MRAAAGELFNRRTECSNGSARDDDDDKKKKRMEFILFYLSLSFFHKRTQFECHEST